MRNLMRGQQHLAEAQKEGLDSGLIRGAQPYVRRSALSLRVDDAADADFVWGPERSVVPGVM